MAPLYCGQCGGDKRAITFQGPSRSWRSSATKGLPLSLWRTRGAPQVAKRCSRAAAAVTTPLSAADGSRQHVERVTAGVVFERGRIVGVDVSVQHQGVDGAPVRRVVGDMPPMTACGPARPIAAAMQGIAARTACITGGTTASTATGTTTRATRPATFTPSGSNCPTSLAP